MKPEPFNTPLTRWLDRESLVLLIIDAQNYSLKRKWGIVESIGIRGEEAGSYYLKIEDQTIPNIAKLLSYFRKNNLPIVYTVNASNHPSHLDSPPLRRVMLGYHEKAAGEKGMGLLGGKDTEIVEELRPLAGELVLSKTTSSAFLSTNLHNILGYQKKDRLVVCGAWLCSCVESTIRDGRDLGYYVTLAEDACVAPTQRFHDSSICVLRSFFCNVMQTGELIENLEQLSQSP